AFDSAPWQAVRAAVPQDDHGAAVLFIADSTTLASPDHPVLVIDLVDDSLRPFRCIPPELWAVGDKLDIANMDWESFAGEVDKDGGVPRPPLMAVSEPPPTYR